jgi:hypothetical protein
LPDHWEQFLLCILLHMVLPCVPLLIELAITKSLSEATVLLFVAMYSLTIGASSRNLLLAFTTVVFGVLFSALFGAVMKSPGTSLGMTDIGLVGLLIIVLIHFIERINRHIIERAPFSDLGRNANGGSKL